MNKDDSNVHANINKEDREKLLLNSIVAKVNAAKNVVILPHVSADGDALGSSIALAIALKKRSKNVDIYVEEEIQRILGFLPCIDLVKLYSNDITKNYDTAIAIDTGDIERMGKRYKIFKSSEVTINIDHHKSNTFFALFNYVDTEASAAGEVIFDLIRLMDIELDEDMAQCLYVAISTDTGGFRFSNTTSLTHKIAAELIDVGLNVSEISKKLFDEVSSEKVKFIGMAIEKLELYEEGRLAVIPITRDDIERAGVRDDEMDGIVSIGRNIIGVELAVFLREVENNQVRVNLRSNSYVDVSEIAKKYSGGGHARAAGCTIMGSVQDVKKKLISHIIKSMTR